MSTESAVAISLTPDQALVLFEWLAREDGKDALPTEHPAELQVLWDLEASRGEVIWVPKTRISEYAIRHDSWHKGVAELRAFGCVAKVDGPIVFPAGVNQRGPVISRWSRSRPRW